MSLEWRNKLDRIQDWKETGFILMATVAKTRLAINATIIA